MMSGAPSLCSIEGVSPSSFIIGATMPCSGNCPVPSVISLTMPLLSLALPLSPRICSILDMASSSKTGFPNRSTSECPSHPLRSQDNIHNSNYE